MLLRSSRHHHGGLRPTIDSRYSNLSTTVETNFEASKRNLLLLIRVSSDRVFYTDTFSFSLFYIVNYKTRRNNGYRNFFFHEFIDGSIFLVDLHDLFDDFRPYKFMRLPQIVYFSFGYIYILAALKCKWKTKNLFPIPHLEGNKRKGRKKELSLL